MDAAAPAAAPAQSLTPVDPGRRILELDVLRGIALLGVLIANIWLWFSGIVFRFPEYHAEVWTLSADGLAFLFIGFFISGKAITTFSFLFGLGFAVQMMRADARGRSIVGHHVKRLAILLGFGVVHAVVFWYGDILMAYALLGFGLLLFRKRRERTLLVWAAILIVAIPIVLGGIPLAMATLNPESAPDPATMLAEMTARNAATLSLFASGDPAQFVQGNLAMLKQFWVTPKALFLLSIFGIFLLGLYAGRRRIFENPQAHRTLLRRIVLYGFTAGLIGTAVSMALQSLPAEEVMGNAWMPLAMMTATAVGMVPFALAYIAAATLLLQRPAWRRQLMHFAPVGRMALTNYLAQTVICISIFYGGGLVGQTGALFGLVLALGIFAVQMGASAWWLARFRYGPMEWLWRSLAYGRFQSMRGTVPATPVVEPSVQ